MAQVVITINRREYAIACGNGEELQIMKLGRMLDEKATALTSQLGQINENHTDEVFCGKADLDCVFYGTVHWDGIHGDFVRDSCDGLSAGFGMFAIFGKSGSQRGLPLDGTDGFCFWENWGCQIKESLLQ